MFRRRKRVVFTAKRNDADGYFASHHLSYTIAVQARALTKILELQRCHGLLAVFSHGDIIRAVIAHFLTVPLDLFQRLQIDPASASLVELDTTCVRVLCVNVPVHSATTITSFFPSSTKAY